MADALVEPARAAAGEPRGSVAVDPPGQLRTLTLGRRVDRARLDRHALGVDLLRHEVEDLATAFVRLGDGATLLLEASWAVYGKAADDFGVTLYGTDGGADINVKNYGWEDTLTIYTDTGGVPAELRPRVRRGEGHVATIRNFVNAINGGDWSSHTGREGLRRAQVIDACYQSALEGREVSLLNPPTPSEPKA